MTSAFDPKLTSDRAWSCAEKMLRLGLRASAAVLAMQRREFITLVGGAATWPVLARGQQGGKVPTIGFLGATTPLLQRSDTTAKRIELLHEIIPGLRRLALLVHSGSASNTLEAVEVQVTAEKLGLEIANH